MIATLQSSILLGVSLCVMTPSVAVDNSTTHDGVVVSAAAGKLVMAKAGGHEVAYAIGENVRISRNGEPAKLDDFQPGDAVRVTVDERGSVVALSTIDVDKIGNSLAKIGNGPAKSPVG
jgi:hypothetical protein